MMKKRNTDGFALIYVVVVIFILCAIALALMSSTLRTLQAQEASIRRMEQKYAAQGEIERLVAELESISLSEESYNHKNNKTECYEQGFKDCLYKANSIINSLPVYSEDGIQIPVSIDFDYITSGDPEITYAVETVQFDVSSKVGSVEIFATLSLTPAVSCDTDHTPESWDEVNGVPIDAYDEYKYSTSCPTTVFISYEITSVDPTPEGGET